MAIHPLSARKILRTVFCGQTEGVYPTESEKIKRLDAIYKELKPRLKIFKALKVGRIYKDELHHYGADKLTILASYKPKNSKVFSYREEDNILICFNKKDELVVKAGYGEAPFTDSNQIVEYYHEVDKKREQSEKNQAKRNKVRKMKEEAVLSHVKTLCTDLNMAYNIEIMHMKMKVSIRLDDKFIIEIDIPYNKFHDILQELESGIKAAIALYNQGIICKITNNKHGSYFWIAPDKKNV